MALGIRAQATGRAAPDPQQSAFTVLQKPAVWGGEEERGEENPPPPEAVPSLQPQVPNLEQNPPKHSCLMANRLLSHHLHPHPTTRLMLRALGMQMGNKTLLGRLWGSALPAVLTVTVEDSKDAMVTSQGQGQGDPVEEQKEPTGGLWSPQTLHDARHGYGRERRSGGRGRSTPSHGRQQAEQLTASPGSQPPGTPSPPCSVWGAGSCLGGAEAWGGGSEPAASPGVRRAAPARRCRLLPMAQQRGPSASPGLWNSG